MASSPRKTRDSALTKARILNVAEEVFAEKGFDGARVDDIALRAGVNKALLYYYFKNKDDILEALFTSAIKDVIRVIEDSLEDFRLDDEEIQRIFELLVNLIDQKKRIIRVMMMESLKASTKRPHLFRITDYFVTGEVDTVLKMIERKGVRLPPGMDRMQMMVTEFFTGIMPLVNYVVFEQQWRKEYGLSDEEMRRRFFEAFRMTHVQYHMASLRSMADGGEADGHTA